MQGVGHHVKREQEQLIARLEQSQAGVGDAAESHCGKLKEHCENCAVSKGDHVEDNNKEDKDVGAAAVEDYNKEDED